MIKQFLDEKQYDSLLLSLISKPEYADKDKNILYKYQNTTNTGIGQNVLIIKITTKEQNKLYLYEIQYYE